MLAVPHDLVVVGRIIDAWGIRGAIKVLPYAHDGAALLEVRQWWLERNGQWDSLEVLSAKAHGEAVTATLVGYTERNVAEQLKGFEVSVSRSRFPVLSDDEYYWVDLIGLDVVNMAGALLGKVESLMETGAHAILEVAPSAPGGATGAQADGQVRQKPRRTLIPFVERYVKSVELAHSRVVVDWGPEYEE